MMDGTGIELYVHLEKLEDEVEQFNNVSKNFGDYIDMYKRQMDIIRYSKMADEYRKLAEQIMAVCEKRE